jgi:hypothetical protein
MAAASPLTRMVRPGCSDTGASTMYSKKVRPASRCSYASGTAGNLIIIMAIHDPARTRRPEPSAWCTGLTHRDSPRRTAARIAAVRYVVGEKHSVRCDGA